MHTIRTRLAGGALALAATAGLLAATAGQQAGASSPGTYPDGRLKGVAVVKDIRAALARRHVRVPGRPVRAVTFGDAEGRNLVVFSLRTDRRAPYTERTRLYVDQFATRHGLTRRLRAVRDQVLCGDGDLTGRFKTGSPALTDNDHDGVAEVTFAYLRGCSGDVSPSTFKLLVLEGGTKYIVRGLSWEDQNGPLTGGGERLAFGTPEPAWSRWPAPLAKRAKEIYHQWTYLAP